MLKLEKLNKYNRKEIHDIFDPDSKFIPQTGTWGFRGIIRVPYSQKDYVFLVTLGSSWAGHDFKEGISEDGILTWQSEPGQKLTNSRIIDFINHDHFVNNIYLSKYSGRSSF